MIKTGKIIKSSREIQRRPWLAALLSLAVPGLGQVYNGTPAHALAFMLLRVMPLLVLPFYSVLASTKSAVPGFIAAHVAVLAVIIAATVEAALRSKKHASIVPAWYNGAAWYVLYAVTGAIVTAASSVVLYTCFTPSIAGDSASGPLVASGDLLLTNRLGENKYTPGETVALADGSPWRIIATGTDRVMVFNGTLVINGEPLKRSVPEDRESLDLHFSSPENIYLEENRGVRYAVEQKMDDPESKGSAALPMKQNEYLAARDLRVSNGWYKVISRDQIWGRSELLFHPPW